DQGPVGDGGVGNRIRQTLDELPTGDDDAITQAGSDGEAVADHEVPPQFRTDAKQKVVEVNIAVEDRAVVGEENHIQFIQVDGGGPQTALGIDQGKAVFAAEQQGALAGKGDLRQTAQGEKPRGDGGQGAFAERTAETEGALQELVSEGDAA